MWNVWRTVLEEHEKLAQARLAAVEIFQNQIADEAKTLKTHKVQVAKKVILISHLFLSLQRCNNDHATSCDVNLLKICENILGGSIEKVHYISKKSGEHSKEITLIIKN